MVKLKAEDQIIDFMVNTEAEMSVATELVAPQRRPIAAGVTRDKLIRPFCLPQKCQIAGAGGWWCGGGNQATHEFLYIPECPVCLLWRDLSKLGAQVTFPPKKDLFSSGLDHLFTFPLGNPSRWMEAAWSFGREARWVKQSRERADPTIPWGLGERYVPPKTPPPGLTKHQAPVVRELKPGAIPVRKCQYSPPLPTGGPSWHLATYK